MQINPFDLLIDLHDWIYIVLTKSADTKRPICLLKYVPFNVLPEKVLGHTWNVGGKPYTKIATSALESRFRDHKYCVYLPDLNLTAYELPDAEIKVMLSPTKKAAEILDSGPLLGDIITQNAYKLLLFLTEEIGIPLQFVGITGSICLGAQIPSISDIDVVIHGAKYINSFDSFVKQNVYNLPSFLHLKDNPDFWVSYSDLKDILRINVMDYGMKAAKKTNKGWASQTPYSIFAYDDVLTPPFGPYFRSPLGSIRMKGRVINSEGNYLMPSRCEVLVTDVEANETNIPEGRLINTIVWVESWCVWYVGHMISDDHIIVQGILVEDASHYRVLVTTDSGYIN